MNAATIFKQDIKICSKVINKNINLL